MVLALLGLPGSALAAVIQGDCVPTLVETNADRIILRCKDGLSSTAPAGTNQDIAFFGISTVLNETERHHANRVLSILITAYVTGRPLQIRYETNWSDGRRPGDCDQSNCRYLVNAALK